MSKLLTICALMTLTTGCYLDDKFKGTGTATCGDTQTDAANCGVCGHDCTKLPNVATAAGVTCSAGKCSVPAAACAAGFGHCSSNADDGCEADLSQPSHCGSCTACASSEPLCAISSSGSTSYSCTASCEAPTPDQCGSTCTNLQSDPANCSACGMACMFAHATAVCMQSACSQGSCLTGYMHCSSDPNSGCETYVAGNDINNCGGCGMACKVGQVCNAGTCAENQVTCATAGITCQQASCYQAGRYSISAGGGIVVDLTNNRNLWTRATRFATTDSHAAIVTDCSTLILEGINGWRLPLITELSALDYEAMGLMGCPICTPAIDQAAFPDTAAATANTNYGECYVSNTYNSTKAWWSCDDECDGRLNGGDPGSGGSPEIYRCIHDPLP